MGLIFFEALSKDSISGIGISSKLGAQESTSMFVAGKLSEILIILGQISFENKFIK